MNRRQRRLSRKRGRDTARGSGPGTAILTAHWDRPGRDRLSPGCQGPSTPEILGRMVDVAELELERRDAKDRS